MCLLVPWRFEGPNECGKLCVGDEKGEGERGGRSQSLIPSDFQTSLNGAISADLVNENVNGKKKATDVGWRAVSSEHLHRLIPADK